MTQAIHSGGHSHYSSHHSLLFLLVCEYLFIIAKILVGVKIGPSLTLTPAYNVYLERNDQENCTFMMLTQYIVYFKLVFFWGKGQYYNK